MKRESIKETQIFETNSFYYFLENGLISLKHQHQVFADKEERIQSPEEIKHKIPLNQQKLTGIV